MRGGCKRDSIPQSGRIPAIGLRYARQDEVGTAFGVTIDFGTYGENVPELLDTVTLRLSDSCSGSCCHWCRDP